MPPKREPSESESLTPSPDEPQKKKQKTTPSKSAISEPIDQFQQITKPEFVDRYRVDGTLDVYYQPEVGLRTDAAHTEGSSSR
jgi:hypothetical protein